MRECTSAPYQAFWSPRSDTRNGPLRYASTMRVPIAVPGGGRIVSPVIRTYDYQLKQ